MTSDETQLDAVTAELQALLKRLRTMTHMAKLQQKWLDRAKEHESDAMVAKAEESEESEELPVLEALVRVEFEIWRDLNELQGVLFRG